jgi:hypothetical protein
MKKNNLGTIFITLKAQVKAMTLMRISHTKKLIEVDNKKLHSYSMG